MVLVGRINFQLLGGEGLKQCTCYAYNVCSGILINEYFCFKDLVPSTINRGITGQKFYPRDRGVLTYHMDPYLTTTQKDHRAFTK